jgi:hypothetical protein
VHTIIVLLFNESVMSVRLYKTQGFREKLVEETKLFDDGDDHVTERQRFEQMVCKSKWKACCMRQLLG